MVDLLDTRMCDQLHPDEPLEDQDLTVQQPQDDEPFVYTDLDASYSEIRLLHIQPRNITTREHPTITPTDISLTIFHTSLASAPSYTALSYSWGAPTSKTYPITLNGRPFLVHQNLFTALKELSFLATQTTIWIDALCINQRSPTERSEQVSLMKRIYSIATCVTVWLGPHADESNRAFWVLRDFMRLLQETPYERSRGLMVEYLADNEPVENPEVPRGLRALAKLFTREYWRRMWIVQELTVARDVVIRVGDYEVPARVVSKVQELLREMPAGSVPACLKHDEYTRNALMLQGMIEIDEWKVALERGTMSFHECLRYHQLRKATNPKDKLFALAGIVGHVEEEEEGGKGKGESLMSLGVQIDYTRSVKSVYTDYARAEIQAHGKLDVLTSVIRSDGTNPHGLPSWVPDWSDEQLGPHLFIGGATVVDVRFCAAGERAASFSFSLSESTAPASNAVVGGPGDPSLPLDILTLKAIKLGTVARVGMKTDMANPEGQVTGARAVCEWWMLHCQYCAEADHLPCVDAFVRTINCMARKSNSSSSSSSSSKGKDPRGSEQSLSSASLPAKRNEMTFADLVTLYLRFRTAAYLPDVAPPLDPLVAERVEGMGARILALRRGEYERKEIRWEFNGELGDEELARKLLSNFVFLWDRRFVLLDVEGVDGIEGRKVMGMAPVWAQVGDLVCVPLGCAHPLVVRREGESWKMLGEAYVEGFMYGQAVEMWEAGKLEVEEFELF